MTKRAALEDIFRHAPALQSEDDCAENIVVPFLNRLGHARSDIARKVTISAGDNRALRKQADLVVQAGGSPALVVEVKRIDHNLNQDDANQVLSYAQLLEPPTKYAVLTNGRDWEVYTLDDDSIGDIESVPEPLDLKVAVRDSPLVIPDDVRSAAARLLLTLENKEELEAAFRRCRQILAREGLIAESAFDELTKILVCKFNEEKRLAEGLGTFRFSSNWIDGEGPLTGLQKMFSDAKQTFRVFPPGTDISIRANDTVSEIVAALEPYGFYGLQTPLGLAGAGGDVVGSVYETFLTGTLRGDLGQYLTPRQIID